MLRNLMIVIVSVSVLIIAIAAVWDARQRRLTGRTPQFARKRPSLLSLYLANSAQRRAMLAQTSERNRPNYGDIGSDR